MTVLQQNQPADGGPAFPSSDLGAEVQPGMSLRDYFAAHALTSLLSLQFQVPPEIAGNAAVYYSTAAYELADAMLQQRKGGQQ